MSGRPGRRGAPQPWHHRSVPRDRRIAPRKPPTTRAGVDIIASILAAASHVLDERGLDGFTTNQVAERAGVSIGSLYQYFAHRDAILTALQERELERALGMMQEVLAEGNLVRTPRETVTAVVRGLTSLYARSPGLHRVLAIEGLRVTEAERVHAFDVRVIGIIHGFLVASDAPLRRENLLAAAFVAFQAVRATMLATLLERPAHLSEDDIVEEVVDLVLRYLVKDGTA